MDLEKLSHAQSFDRERLRQWFFLNRRPLPWRENPSPYEVWVSEVMLQQTQVSVVVPYFKRWMTLFPTISALAAAPLEKVIKAWEGLGYYSRARNLHEGARYLTEHHGGELPDTYEDLKNVKGLGPYTIGAILSFAFKQKAAAVDGNVFRVLARYFAIEEPIDKSFVQKEIRTLTAALLPDDEPWIIMEGLIELGALVCQKKAQCEICPLKMSCLGRCKAALLPIKSKREKTIHLHRTVAVIHTGQELLLRKGEAGKVMADLHEFPYFDRDVNIEEALGLSLKPQRALPEVTHGFTKYKAFLYPHLYLAARKEIEGHSWVPFQEVKEMPFSSGHRRILFLLRNNQLLNI
ncbi:A/G-specific adenine glycosylase [Candidatus Neptunochlamydia vexilliferae]|uniref:A/G-specific adenine glycosylase n=1 Tax=Candidatus Neptunichlamydia vexilliferae TaxID=1651774 RepID=UPI001890BD38|nr:A/G-specific adenine glycosylase [Candidatus Neptunochlamydia vexilliferae]